MMARFTRWLRGRKAAPEPQRRRVLLQGDARAILESITDGFLALGEDWRFMYVNSQAEVLLGADAESLLGRVIWEVTPGLTGGPFEAAYRRAASERTLQAFTAFHADHDRWYEERVYPAPYGISVFFRDVSEARRVDAALERVAREAEHQRIVYETALSHSADFNYVFDTEGRFVFVNRTLLALWQKSLPEVLGKNFFELDYPPELAARLQRQIGEVLQHGQALRDETRYTSAAGTRSYEYIFVPVKDAQGQVVAVVGSTRDITEHKETEEALRDSDRRKDEFLATLAHELRNPLAPLRNGLEIVRLSEGHPEKIAQATQLMERQLQHLVRMVDDLVDLSRLSRGKVELRLERLPVGSVVQQAVETVRPLLEQAAHHLSIETPAEAVWIDADPTRLTQALANLLHNAVKFTPRGGSLRLSVHAATPQSLHIVVADNGRGIAEAMQPRIFDMFTQAEVDDEQMRSGLGIGLALVKGLVALHQGHIEVHSAGTGQGSEFTLHLPRAAAPVEPARPADAATPEAGASRVLVVDDNREAALSMAEVLELMGHVTRVAFDGQEGVELAADFAPTVVLMDLGMPRMNGYEAARLIRQQPGGGDRVLVALTGWGNEQERQKSQAAGFDHHLVKPADFDVLCGIIEDSVRAQRGRDVPA